MSILNFCLEIIQTEKQFNLIEKRLETLLLKEKQSFNNRWASIAKVSRKIVIERLGLFPVKSFFYFSLYWPLKSNEIINANRPINSTKTNPR